MIAILALTTVAIATFAGIFIGAYALLRPTWAVDRLLRQEVLEPTTESSRDDFTRKVLGLMKWFGGKIPRPAEELSRQGLRLVQAGIRRKDGPIVYLGVQVGVVILLFVGFVVTGFFVTHPIMSPILALLGGAALPDLALKLKIRRRQERLQHALPDTLDLTVVCVEAGMGLDQSLQRIGEELAVSYPDLSDELKLFQLETRSGQSRATALRNLANRTKLDDVRSLAAMLIQTERFGTSIGQSLRVFAEGMRTKRRQRAEERAAKIAVKMIPPMVLFVFPSIFVVVAGPAVVSIVQRLLPMLSGSGN